MAALVPAAALLQASAAEPALVQLVAPSTNAVWVGERVSFAVQLLVPGQFSGAAYFDLPEVEGVILMRPSERPLLGTETVDGESYVAQRHEFVLFAQRPGAFTVPPLTARFSSKERFDKPAVDHRLKTPPLRIQAVAPEGLRPDEVVVSTTAFEATETWNPTPSDAVTGAAFTRTITMRANNVPGMLLPALRYPRTQGLGVYPKPPQVNDRTERGEFTGTRIESVTYICEAAGTVQLPPIEIRWWNPATTTWHTNRFPAVSLEVADNPALTSRGPDQDGDTASTASPSARWVRRGSWIVGGMALLWLSPWFLRRLQAIRQARATSERAQFARLIQACNRSDASAVDQEFNRWLARSGASKPHTRAGHGRGDDEAWSREWLGLQRCLAGLQPDWDGRALSHELRRLRRQRRARSTTAPAGLKPLNPHGPQ